MGRRGHSTLRGLGPPWGHVPHRHRRSGISPRTPPAPPPRLRKRKALEDPAPASSIVAPGADKPAPLLGRRALGSTCVVSPRAVPAQPSPPSPLPPAEQRVCGQPRAGAGAGGRDPSALGQAPTDQWLQRGFSQGAAAIPDHRQQWVAGAAGRRAQEEPETLPSRMAPGAPGLVHEEGWSRRASSFLGGVQPSSSESPS